MLSSMDRETYALTTVAYQRQRIFQVTANCELLIATILRYRDASRFLLHGFAVMPEHLHVLITPAETIERTAQLIKGGFSHSIRKTRRCEVWQPGYFAHRVTSKEDFYNQLAYIADNPVKRGVLDHPHVYTDSQIGSIRLHSIGCELQTACRRG
jgi:putative transposase